jgi:hypothetical protein
LALLQLEDARSLSSFRALREAGHRAAPCADPLALLRGDAGFDVDA